MNNNQNNNPIDSEKRPINYTLDKSEVEKKKKGPSLALIVIIILGALIIYRRYGNGGFSFLNHTSGSGTSWKKLEFSVDGVKKQLPLTKEELIKDLPDGWKIVDLPADEIRFNLVYGTDNSEETVINLTKDKETNLINLITVSEDSMTNPKFEISGISFKSKEKDILKKAGIPATMSYGKLVGKTNEKLNGFAYTYLKNGLNTNEGYLIIMGSYEGEEHIEHISLVNDTSK